MRNPKGPLPNARPVRSDKYQNQFLEIGCDLHEFAKTTDLSARLHASDHSQPWLELNDQAMECIMQCVQSNLTQKQVTVLSMTLEGYTQMEIAKILDVNQSSITKMLNGNIDYTGGERRYYGGIVKKMRKAIRANISLPPILLAMRYADDIFNQRPIPIFYKTERTCSVNIYYLASTMFKNDDEYLQWQRGKYQFKKGELPHGNADNRNSKGCNGG